MRTIALVLGCAGMSACATPGDSAADPNTPAECRAEAGQTYIGQRATPAVGAELLQATGARQLRWAPPDSALTMDFRPDRLTVHYDRNFIIEEVACG